MSVLDVGRYTQHLVQFRRMLYAAPDGPPIVVSVHEVLFVFPLAGMSRCFFFVSRTPVQLGLAVDSTSGVNASLTLGERPSPALLPCSPPLLSPPLFSSPLPTLPLPSLPTSPLRSRTPESS